MFVSTGIIIALMVNLFALSVFAEETSYVLNDVVCVSSENGLGNYDLEVLQQQGATVAEAVYNTESSNVGLLPYEINSFLVDCTHMSRPLIMHRQQDGPMQSLQMVDICRFQNKCQSEE